MEENTEVADAVVETTETTETPEAVAPSSETKTSSDDHFDVFQWANNVDEIKNNVSVELFLFNKNYSPYKVRYSETLTQVVKSMFLLEAVEFIVKEADKGLECRDYETSDGEDKVIYKLLVSDDLL